MNGKISIKRSELNLKMMLEGGQSFRWKKITENEWLGVVANFIWTIRQFDNHIEYERISLEKVPNSERNSKKRSTCNQADDLLKNYLRINVDINEHYKEWSIRDSNFRRIAANYSGIRLLNQDPVENVFSFICSSNNNIKRITNMITKLTELYGKKIANYKETTYYSFPTVSALAQPTVEAELRKAGFGYRAKYIYKCAQMLNELDDKNFLYSLKSKSYEYTKNELMKFPGIGAKVADCICLMSLGHLQAVPVDTHVFKIASELYLPHLRKVKSVTNKIYDEIADHFRELYGPMAGWAHVVLFCADLKTVGGSINDSIRPSVSTQDVIMKMGSRKALNIKKNDDSDENVKIETGSIDCCRDDLHLAITLNSGQTYRWKSIGTDVWRGVYHGRVWTLEQSDDHIDFTSVRSIKDEPPHKIGSLGGGTAEQLLHEYFRLDFPLKEYYTKWARDDQHFKDISRNFYGLRMIRQDIVENLFAFICSSNNTINRMRHMVESLCKLYGEEIANVDNEVYYDFPSVTKLCADSVVHDLRKANFGFRADYVKESARYIMENGGQQWFHNICKLSYKDAKDELIKLPGIGAKVADCICLTALDHLNTIPVDTHVFQIATKYYLPHLKPHTKTKSKSVSAKAYQEIGDCFRNIFGEYAGWAHTVLFCSDLRQHSNIIKSNEKE